MKRIVSFAINCAVVCVLISTQFGCNLSSGTNSESDELLQESKNTYQFNRRDAKVKALSAIELSREAGNKKFEIRGIIRLADVIRFNHPVDTLFFYDLEAIRLANALNDPKLKFLAVSAYARDLSSFNYLQQSVQYVDSARTLADTDQESKMQFLNLEGLNYFKQKINDKADSLFSKSLTFSRELKDSNAIVSNMLYLFRNSVYQGRIDTTLSGALTALNYYERNKQPEAAANAKFVIGESFQFVANFSKAFDFFDQAYTTFAKNGNHFQAAGVKAQYVQSYQMKGIMQDALPAIQEMQRRFDTLKFSFGQAIVMNNFGQYYSAIGDFTKADKYLKKGAAIAEKYNYLPMVAISIQLQAQNLERQKKFKEADKLAIKGYEYAGQLASKQLRENIHGVNGARSEKDALEVRLENDSVYRAKYGTQALSDWRKANKKKGDTAFYSGSLLSAFDSTMASNYNAQLLTLETQYRTRLKEDSLKIERQNNIIAQQSLKMNNVYLLGASFVTLALASGLWFQYRNRKRAERDKAKIQLLQNEIHHRVKNNLGVISRLVEVAGKNSLDEIPLSSLKNRIKAIEILHQNLYSDQAKTGNVSLQNYLEELCSSIANTIDTGKQIRININAREEVLGELAEKLGLIINELVTNSYKYAFMNQQSGEININANKVENNRLQVSVTDNGSGFEPGGKTNYGMKLIKGLSNELRGKFEFINSAGTRFNLLVPVSA